MPDLTKPFISKLALNTKYINLVNHEMGFILF